MRRNRKIPKKMSVVAVNTLRFGAIIVFFFVMVILNLLSSSSCTQLHNAKGELEREIARLDDARMRESTRWEEMTTPENVEEALVRFGIAMRPPRPEQLVRMSRDGKPHAGQISIARLKASRSVRTANVTPAVRAQQVSSRPPYRRPCV